MKPGSALCSVALIYLSGAPLFAAEISIQTNDNPAASSVIVIENPRQLTGGTLRNGDQKPIPVQQRNDGKLVFVTNRLPANSTITYQFTASSPDASVEAKQEDDQIVLSRSGNSVATYQMASRKSPRPDLDPKFLRGGYLHPLQTPSGKTVTDDYTLNHLHHHGIWTAWTKTSFDGREPDFWNMGQGKGKVDFASLDSKWSGPVEAGFVSRLKHTDLTGSLPVHVLDETWTVRTYSTGKDFNIIDLESSQKTTGNIPLLLPIYHYGGIGIRGLESWNGKDAISILTSEGSSDRNKTNGKPARWFRMSGKAGDATASIIILGHPENFRAPQPARIHPNEPFISFAPQTNEAMSIKPGETYFSKFRFIIADGEPDAAMIDALWQDYANPITAKWIQ